jgi:hypothetical protein
MEAKESARERERQKLLNRLAELQLEEFRETGTFDSTPHFSTIEEAAHQLGQALSRQVQEQTAREVASSAQDEAPCPTCGRSCRLKTSRRTVKGIDGPFELDEVFGECRRCRRSFFPSAD